MDSCGALTNSSVRQGEQAVRRQQTLLPGVYMAVTYYHNRRQQLCKRWQVWRASAHRHLGRQSRRSRSNRIAGLLAWLGGRALAPNNNLGGLRTDVGIPTNNVGFLQCALQSPAGGHRVFWWGSCCLGRGIRIHPCWHWCCYCLAWCLRPRRWGLDPAPSLLPWRSPWSDQSHIRPILRDAQAGDSWRWRMCRGCSLVVVVVVVLRLRARGAVSKHSTWA